MRTWFKDLLVLIAVFALLLGGLFAYTHVWPPAVIVESSSMMHPDSEVHYGRIGTIDPGDLVLVKSVDAPTDIGTLMENSPGHYGKPGDVIIYYSANDRASVPIIHRAVAWVEPTPDGNFRARWDPSADCVDGATKNATDAHWCDYGPGGVTITSVGLVHFSPAEPGFITKGDNPVSNYAPDQMLGIARDARGHPSVVPMSWIEGKARGELPWIGLLKLSLAGKANERNPPKDWTHILSAYAPTDLWVCLAITLAVVIGGPLLWDAAKAYRVKHPK
jgi:signal peptidase I